MITSSPKPSKEGDRVLINRLRLFLQTRDLTARYQLAAKEGLSWLEGTRPRPYEGEIVKVSISKNSPFVIRGIKHFTTSRRDTSGGATLLRILTIGTVDTHSTVHQQTTISLQPNVTGKLLVGGKSVLRFGGSGYELRLNRPFSFDWAPGPPITILLENRAEGEARQAEYALARELGRGERDVKVRGSPVEPQQDRASETVTHADYALAGNLGRRRLSAQTSAAGVMIELVLRGPTDKLRLRVYPEPRRPE